jgi:pSer/pThr/pTyr-binding forkhead associated (FHA) protein
MSLAASTREKKRKIVMLAAAGFRREEQFGRTRRPIGTPSQEPSMPNLLITSGNHAGKYFPLASRPLSVGRDPARDIQLTDPKVSRKQCMIQRRGEEYVLRPFESVNAVLINGAEIRDEIVLNDHDEIQLGNTTLRFCAADDPARTNALEQRKLADRRMRSDPTINERS